MGYYNLVMPEGYAWDILNAVGELDALHFIDMYVFFKNNNLLI